MSDTSTGPASGGEPERLESHSASSSGGAGGRRGVLAGGVVALLVVGGAAAWAATSFLGQGEQPAVALPDETVLYAAVDLDPSGGQKLEALETLRKFPALEGAAGLGADDDIREELVTRALDDTGCEDVDYAADVEPWLGNRMAVAGVDTDGEAGGEPTPVVVLQVSDADAADEGLATVREACAADELGWQISDGWAVLAPDAEVAGTVVDLAGEGTLADDEDYQRWTGEAGDPGVATVYAAPEAGRLLLDNAGLLGPLPNAPGLEGLSSGEVPSTGLPPETTAALEDFEGAAATLRFDDGGVELELAADLGQQVEGVEASDAGAGVVETLPADTAVALGVGLGDGWVGQLLDRAAASSQGEMTGDDLAAELEQMVGVTPEQLETLFGDSVAVALGPEFSVESFFASSGPEELPVGIKVAGDAAEIESVLAELQPLLGPMAPLLEAETAEGVVAVSPNDDFRSALAEDGGLGETETFDEVIDDAGSAAALLYVDFDAGDGGWLSGLASGDPRLEENLAPLSALGVTGSIDGDVSRAVVRLTTD